MCCFIFQWDNETKNQEVQQEGGVYVFLKDHTVVPNIHWQDCKSMEWLLFKKGLVGIVVHELQGLMAGSSWQHVKCPWTIALNCRFKNSILKKIKCLPINISRRSRSKLQTYSSNSSELIST